MAEFSLLASTRWAVQGRPTRYTLRFNYRNQRIQELVPSILQQRASKGLWCTEQHWEQYRSLLRFKRLRWPREWSNSIQPVAYLFRCSSALTVIKIISETTISVLLASPQYSLPLPHRRVGTRLGEDIEYWRKRNTGQVLFRLYFKIQKVATYFCFYFIILKNRASAHRACDAQVSHKDLPMYSLHFTLSYDVYKLKRSGSSSVPRLSDVIERER